MINQFNNAIFSCPRFYLSLALFFVIAGCSKNSPDSPENNAITAAKPYDPNSLTYWVDGQSGNDAGDGKTAATAWKTIQAALNNATPGSQVFIKGGTVYHEQVLVNVSGTAEHPITFSGYGPLDPVLDGSGLKGQTMFSLTNASYLSFSHLVIQNLIANNAQGIAVTATARGGCSDLSFHHITLRHIAWNSDSGRTPTASDNAQPFIVYGRGLTTANAVSRLTIDSSLVEDNIPGFSECISLDGNIDGFSISANTVHLNSNIGIAVIGNYGTSPTATLDQARNGLISGNTCDSNIAAYATAAGIYADGARDIVIERNRCAGNGFGIEIGCEENGSASGIKVAGNLLMKNQIAGLAMGGYNAATSGQVLNCSAYNNTFFHNNSSGDGTGELYLTKLSACFVENNLFIISPGLKNLFTADAISPQANNVIDYNNWYCSTSDVRTNTVLWRGILYSGFDNYRQETMQEAHSLTSDPLVLNVAEAAPDLHLSGGSTLRDKGNAGIIQPGANTGFDGDPLISAGSASIGAYP